MNTLDPRTIPSGQTRTGSLEPDVGHPVEIPYSVVRGARPGPTLLVTAGVHGAEYASIEAAYRVARTPADEVAGTLVVLPIVNPPAFFARTIYVGPLDGKNLNRAFPGRPDGTFTERLAHWLVETFVRHADAYVDLHGGDMIESLTPFSIHAEAHDASRDLAVAFGLPNLVASGGTGMSYAAGAALGVPSVLAEAGGQGRWPDESVEPLVLGVDRVMRHLGMRPGALEPLPVRALDAFDWLRSDHDGLWYPSVTAGDEVDVGQEIGVVKDLTGRPLQRATASVAGVVLFAVESLAITAGDPLAGVGAGS